MMHDINDSDLNINSTDDLIRLKPVSGRERNLNDITLPEKIKRLIDYGNG